MGEMGRAYRGGLAAGVSRSEDSHISLSAETTGVRDEAIHVSLSKFLGPVDLELNPQFNCLIGGRGTGKSSILEYIRWGLCDQPPAFRDVDEVPDFQSKRAALIANTLSPHKASVTVEFSVNGVRHVVRRNSETNEILLKVASDDFRQVREQDVRELLPLQAYSQKQLSAVGVRADELLRFVEAPVARKLSELSSLENDAVASIRTAYDSVLQKRILHQRISRQEVELASLDRQQEATRGGLGSLAEADREVLANQERYSVEQGAFGQWALNVDKALETARRAKADLQRLPFRYAGDQTLPNDPLLTKADALIGSLFSAARVHIEAIEQLFSEQSGEWRAFGDIRRGWEAKKEAVTRQFEAVKLKAVEHEAILKQVSEIDGRINSLRATVAERRSPSRRMGTRKQRFKQLKNSGGNYSENEPCCSRSGVAIHKAFGWCYPRYSQARCRCREAN